MREGNIEIRHLLEEDLQTVSDVLERGCIFHGADNRPVTGISIDTEGILVHLNNRESFRVDPFTNVEVRRIEEIYVWDVKTGDGSGVIVRVRARSAAEAKKKLEELSDTAVIEDPVIGKWKDIEAAFYFYPAEVARGKHFTTEEVEE